MTLEGVGETSGLADALSIFGVSVGVLFVRLKSFDAHYLEADLRRLLQSLQNFGQIVPFSNLAGGFRFILFRLCTFSAAHAPRVV